MSYEPEEIIVLGAIKRGAKKFEKIQKTTGIEPEQVNEILERLEQQGMIQIQEKKGLLGRKVEIFATERGHGELEQRIGKMQKDWDQMVQVYKSGDKKKLNEQMDGFKGFFPMMMFFGVIDLMMFSTMFGMIGASMTDYVPADQIPADSDAGSDVGDAGADGGGFDFDIGF